LNVTDWTAADPDALLSIAEMGEADRLAMSGGVAWGAVPGEVLMEHAGRAVVQAMLERWPRETGSPYRVLVLAGPGNNGGDGFVVARLLKEIGVDVSVALLGDRKSLTGDAAAMAIQWDHPVMPLAAARPEMVTLVVDALFGAGLSRPVDGEAASVLRRVAESDVPVVAVDMPSGVHGDTGAVLGIAAPADLTVTFARLKPGHLLMPGRALCGETVIADIGIPEAALASIPCAARATSLDFVRHVLPYPREGGHKYDRGHVVAVSGPAHATGAARLAAMGALRIGAGLVTVASPPEAVAVNAAHLTAIMLAPFDGAAGLSALLADPRRNTAVIGPGCGVGQDTRALVEAVLAACPAAVLDADALTSFADDSKALFGMLHDGIVLTPHEGEFARLFPDLAAAEAGKLARARQAAARAGVVVLLKGADTVVAHPDGGVYINANAPPFLATAGAGDVLAGYIAGLLAQGMAPFEAAAAAAWLHGAAASLFGPGLIAEDLPPTLPRVLEAVADYAGPAGEEGP
jgi:hydroxyethylthiazole kinase-like uncharacterized protein yjeF